MRRPLELARTPLFFRALSQFRRVAKAQGFQSGRFGLGEVGAKGIPRFVALLLLLAQGKLDPKPDGQAAATHPSTTAQGYTTEGQDPRFTDCILQFGKWLFRLVP